MDPPRQDRRHHGRTGAGAARSSPVRRGNAMDVNLVFLHSRPASSSPMTICYITDLLVSLRYLPLTSPARIRTGTIATLRSFYSRMSRTPWMQALAWPLLGSCTSRATHQAPHTCTPMHKHLGLQDTPGTCPSAGDHLVAVLSLKSAPFFQLTRSSLLHVYSVPHPLHKLITSPVACPLLLSPAAPSSIPTADPFFCFIHLLQICSFYIFYFTNANNTNEMSIFVRKM